MSTATYMQTVATVTNASGQSVTVNGPTVPEWAPLSPDWKRTYRRIALELAANAGLPLESTGVRVTWRKEAL